MCNCSLLYLGGIRQYHMAVSPVAILSSTFHFYLFTFPSSVKPSISLCSPLFDLSLKLVSVIYISHVLTLSFCPPLSVQECPSGIVNEETFKQIYSQFFPHGGKDRVCAVLFASLSLSTQCVDKCFYFFSSASCRCQHLCTLPVQCI